MANELTTLPLTEPISLQVRLGHGGLRVATRDDATEATVQLTPRGDDADLLDRVTVQLRGRTLVVAGPRQGGLADILRGWRGDRDAIDAVIEIPHGSRVTIASASDEITVTGRCGPADVAAAAGRISVDMVDGDLRLRYGHADCHIGHVTGEVRLNAGSGAVQLDEVGGSFVGQLGRGDLELGAAHGEVHVRNGHGAVHIDAAYGNVDVATGSGAVAIGIPTGIAARVDATTGFGRVVSDLPVDQRPAPGAQAITIRARTGKGDIGLQRFAAAAA